MHLRTIIFFQKRLDFKESKEGYIGGFGEGKGKRKLSFKRKNFFKKADKHGICKRQPQS